MHMHIHVHTVHPVHIQFHMPLHVHAAVDGCDAERLWQVLTRSLPFTGMNPVQIGLAVREQKLRPEMPANCPEGFSALLADCWHDEPEQRSWWSIASALRGPMCLA